MRHLYQRLYLALVGILIVSLLAFAIGIKSTANERGEHVGLAKGMAELLVQGLPPEADPRFQEAVQQRAGKLGIEVMLWSAERAGLAHTTPVPVPFPSTAHRGFFQVEGTPGMLIELDDGRYFAALFPEQASPHQRLFRGLLLFALVAAVLCYPIARGITRRLEELQGTVQLFGQGQLGQRARVKGKDEVASLARQFNTAAARIESLVGQQKRMLASASHELRSPLSRVAMAVTLLGEAGPERRAELERQIEGEIRELDELIEDLLLAARAEGAIEPVTQSLDLAELVRAETERLGGSVDVEAISMRGDKRMLRRLVRNLVENAERHGGGQAIEVSLRRKPDVACLIVEDRGPGVAPAARERIFEPFYREQGHDEARTGGVGLGLALVRQVAEHHGGRARYEARDDGGSRFVVELPIEGDDS